MHNTTKFGLFCFALTEQGPLDCKARPCRPDPCSDRAEVGAYRGLALQLALHAARISNIMVDLSTWPAPSQPTSDRVDRATKRLTKWISTTPLCAACQPPVLRTQQVAQGLKTCKRTKHIDCEHAAHSTHTHSCIGRRLNLRQVNEVPTLDLRLGLPEVPTLDLRLGLPEMPRRQPHHYPLPLTMSPRKGVS